MSEPFFPPPDAGRERGAGGYREPATKAASSETPARTTVVRRADPPPTEVDAAGAKRDLAKLSKEEVGALLAVRGATPSTLSRVGRRVVVLVPVGLFRALFDAIVDAPLVGMAITGVLVLAAFAWIAAPLWQQKKDGFV